MGSNRLGVVLAASLALVSCGNSSNNPVGDASGNQTGQDAAIGADTTSPPPGTEHDSGVPRTDSSGMVTGQGDLDVIFVVGTWSSMGRHQEALAAGSRAFLSDLQAAGLDLRIGVMSADIGAQATGYVRIPDTTCKLEGDGGSLLVKAGCGLNAGATYLQVANGSANVSGQATDALACMLKLGDTGCTYGQPLAALLRKLPANPAEFLRKSATLLVVFVTDADDCSAGFVSQFFDDPHGPFQARRLRCAIQGHICNARSLEEVEQTWPLSSCREEILPDDLLAVRDLVPKIKKLKEDPNAVKVAVVTGWPQDVSQATYSIYTHSSGALQLADVCSSEHGSAQPALRLKAFVDAFGPRGLALSLCADDLSPTLRQVAQLAITTP